MMHFTKHPGGILRAKGGPGGAVWVMTHLCCETTARSAFTRGSGLLPVDGTATYNRAFHRASLLNLAHGFASLTFVEDILEKIRGEYGG
jgi:isochorismate hydrolase